MLTAFININICMVEIVDSVKNIKRIYMSDASLEILLDFERVLDSMDLYVFPHWKLGELVEVEIPG